MKGSRACLALQADRGENGKRQRLPGAVPRGELGRLCRLTFMAFLCLFRPFSSFLFISLYSLLQVFFFFFLHVMFSNCLMIFALEALGAAFQLERHGDRRRVG